MFDVFEAAETLTGIDDPAGITIIHPAEPTRDRDECNSSHPASDLIPFPWKERFKSVVGDRDVEYDIEFSVCDECNEPLKASACWTSQKTVSGGPALQTGEERNVSAQR